MKRTLLALIFSSASLTAFAQPTSSAPDDPNGPKMVVAVDTYAFDSITQGDTVKYTFTFKNTGKAPLIITDALVGCGCTTPVFSKEPIAPGKSGTIYVEFRSIGKMGYQDKTVTIKSNSNTGDVVLHLKGTVVAAPKAPTPGVADPTRGNVPLNK